MKISVVISVYNSHRALARQVEYFKRLHLPDDVEFIIVDDGSNPTLKAKMKNLSIYKTNNKLAWTQGLGRNLGASMARGDYLLMTDIDHIISKSAFQMVYNYSGSMLRFRRMFGILTRSGKLMTDKKSLKKYGLAEEYLNKKELSINTHRNSFAIKRSIFNEIGGYKKKWCKWGFHPSTRSGDDCYFDQAWRKYACDNNLDKWPEIGPAIFVFPNGRFHKDKETNPHGLFHDLSYDFNKPFNKP